MPKFTGKNLSVSIGGTAVPCPQSADVTPQQEFVEFYCVGTDGKQKIHDGTNWSGSVVWLPDNDDHADLSAFNADETKAVIIYPDGNVNGRIKITFNAFPSAGLSTQRSNPGSSTINLVIDGAVTIGSATGS